MANLFNQDFQDFIHALNNNNVEYILVGDILLFFMAILEIPPIRMFG
jgi:hypothetical protein